MDTVRDNIANQSMNSKALGVFMFLAGLVLTLGTYGVGIIIGGPLMLMGIAFPIWRNAMRKHGADLSQDQAAHSGGVVMSQDESHTVAKTAHQATREKRHSKQRYHI